MVQPHSVVSNVSATLCAWESPLDTADRWTACVGGHINPAVTLGFVITARISIPRAFLYMIFQCLGACTGSALVKAVWRGVLM